MKVLTVQQPWAWAIIHGGKDVENRTQLWKYRGPLAIHAGTRWSVRGGASRLIARALHALGYTEAAETLQDAGFFAVGDIVGVVDLVDVHLAQPDCCESPWAEQSYDEHGGRTRRDVVHLALENPRPLAHPVPAKGRLGLWAMDPETWLKVDAQLWADEFKEGRR